jgi:hypothetical protein
LFYPAACLEDVRCACVWQTLRGGSLFARFCHIAVRIIGVKGVTALVNEIEGLAASTDFSIRQIQKKIASGDRRRNHKACPRQPALMGKSRAGCE